MLQNDWTMDKVSRRANSSIRYLDIVCVVESLLKDGNTCLSKEWIQSKARTIVSHLAHHEHLAPEQE